MKCLDLWLSWTGLGRLAASWCTRENPGQGRSPAFLGMYRPQDDLSNVICSIRHGRRRYLEITYTYSQFQGVCKTGSVLLLET